MAEKEWKKQLLQVNAVEVAALQHSRAKVVRSLQQKCRDY